MKALITILNMELSPLNAKPVILANGIAIYYIHEQVCEKKIVGFNEVFDFNSGDHFQCQICHQYFLNIFQFYQHLQISKHTLNQEAIEWITPFVKNILQSKPLIRADTFHENLSLLCETPIQKKIFVLQIQPTVDDEENRVDTDDENTDWSQQFDEETHLWNDEDYYVINVELVAEASVEQDFNGVYCELEIPM